MTMEFRKEFFADERDDNLNEIGKPTTERLDFFAGQVSVDPLQHYHSSPIARSSAATRAISGRRCSTREASTPHRPIVAGSA